MRRPSGVHAGLTFSAALSVTGTGAPPTAGTSTMALGPLFANCGAPTANWSFPATRAIQRPTGKSSGRPPRRANEIPGGRRRPGVLAQELPIGGVGGLNLDPGLKVDLFDLAERQELRLGPG